MIGKIQKGEEIIIVEYNRDKTWAHVVAGNGPRDGWAATADFKMITEQPVQSVKELSVSGGFGARLAYGQLFFTDPQKRSEGGSGGANIQFGIDVQLAEAIKRSTSSVDVAAFEFNNKELTEAILDVKERGIQVRMVTDKENGLEGRETSFHSFINAGIPVVCRESRSGLMHNKFTILDGKTVWTGSWNYTQGGTYRNNENSIAFDAPEVAALYRSKFEDMFTLKKFGGKTSKDNLKKVSALGIPVEVCFTPDQTIGNYIRSLILSAKESVHFMMLAFTNDDFGNAILNCHAHGVQVFGMQEERTARASASEFKKLAEGGVQVRYDRNPYMLNHAIVVIDKIITITGSMNFTHNALENNDENVIIIHDLVLAELYLKEFERQWRDGKSPDEVDT
jgi:phosphatidylserine/phosphatidylglycerophosphate/cardiolipin synthase-like enzyme